MPGESRDLSKRGLEQADDAPQISGNRVNRSRLSLRCAPFGRDDSEYLLHAALLSRGMLVVPAKRMLRSFWYM